MILSPHGLSPKHTHTLICTVHRRTPPVRPPSDRRWFLSIAQPLSSLYQARIVARTNRGRARPEDQSRDWLACLSSNRRATTAPASLSSTTVLEVLGRFDLLQVKLEPAPVKSCTRRGKSFFIRRRHATARLPEAWDVLLELRAS